jgi:hypothetical protein
LTATESSVRENTTFGIGRQILANSTSDPGRLQRRISLLGLNSRSATLLSRIRLTVRGLCAGA